MTKRSRYLLYAVLGLVGLAAVIALRIYYAPPSDEYRDHTPPPGPNARPAKSDPNKMKQMQKLKRTH